MERDELDILVNKVGEQVKAIEAFSDGRFHVAETARFGCWFVRTDEVTEQSCGFSVWYDPSVFELKLLPAGDRIVMRSLFANPTERDPCNHQVPHMAKFEINPDETDVQAMFPKHPDSSQVFTHLIGWMNSKLCQPLAKLAN